MRMFTILQLQTSLVIIADIVSGIFICYDYKAEFIPCACVCMCVCVCVCVYFYFIIIFIINGLMELGHFSKELFKSKDLVLGLESGLGLGLGLVQMWWWGVMVKAYRECISISIRICML